MRLTRIHVPAPLAAGAEIELPAQAGEHLTRVLAARGRRRAHAVQRHGRRVRRRHSARATASTSSRACWVTTPVERDSPLHVTLLQGVARGERMDLIVQKATELGVTRIVPVLAERSVVKVDARQRARKLEHWQAIAISACEQCGRNRVPTVAEPLPLGDAIGQLAPDSRTLLCWRPTARLLAHGVRYTRRGPCLLALLIGPEGGLADNERQFALANGFEGCRLGPRILRTETAGLAALAALQVMAGDFSIEFDKTARCLAAPSADAPFPLGRPVAGFRGRRRTMLRRFRGWTRDQT